MALPDAWVDHLFAKLAIRYGDAWARRWDGLPMSAVRADWADVLDRLPGEALTYGLAHLPPDFPPTAAAFRQLCNARPAQEQLPQLPAPSQHVRENLLALRDGLRQIGTAPPRQWAHRLLQRHEAGEHIATPAALDMARTTLRARRDELAVSEYQSPRDAA